MNPNDRLWQITLTQRQMCLMMNALEDWHRFLCGQCSMAYATSFIDSPKRMRLTRDLLDCEVKSAMFPELEPGASYSWDGGQPNTHMSEAAAMSYLLYREIRHQLALTTKPTDYSVYLSPTLTCDQQGPMIEVKPLPQEPDQ